MQLRPYQQEAINALYRYYETHKGNALWCLPTGSGKSVLQAAFIRGAFEQYPHQRMMLLSHVRELLEQNGEKIRLLWPEADIGFYSAGLKRRDTDKAITVAGIQSCHRIAHEFGAISLVIIDEAHLLPKRGEGMYRRFLADLKKINPKVKVIGMTATPYRMGSGLLHKGEGAIFTDIAYEANITELVKDGYLCPLVSKLGATRADLSKVKVRNGEFVAGELEKTMDTDALVSGAIDEVMQLCADRNKWLLFCSGVDHAIHVRDELRARGIAAECVTGQTPNEERDRILADFKAGRLRAVTNMNVLTTGFDAPDIDAIIMLRPTLSPGLYVQALGRGMRVHPSKANTLVLDFAGNVLRHGPIDKIKVCEKNKKDDEVSTAPMRECENCQALMPISARECPECGHVHERATEPKHETKATDSEVMSGTGRTIHTVAVDDVAYARHNKPGKPPSLRVNYRCGLSQFSEWVCLEHDGYARKKAERWWALRNPNSETVPATVRDGLQLAGSLLKPQRIIINTEGRYPNIIGYRDFSAPEAA